jgi:hypothetical protein
VRMAARSPSISTDSTREPSGVATAICTVPTGWPSGDSGPRCRSSPRPRRRARRHVRARGARPPPSGWRPGDAPGRARRADAARRPEGSPSRRSRRRRSRRGRRARPRYRDDGGGEQSPVNDSAAAMLQPRSASRATRRSGSPATTRGDQGALEVVSSASGCSSCAPPRRDEALIDACPSRCRRGRLGLHGSR